MVLDRSHADIPPCATCVKTLFDKDWKVVKNKRTGEPEPRPRGTKPPCFKCPKGPEPFVNEPTLTTLRTLDYYHACCADTGGLLPRDRRVIENIALIERFRQHLDRRQADPMLFLTALMAMNKAR